jgi:phenylacetate-CoA ligase
MPVLRYRTRDIASLERGPCPCGRVGARMGRVVGRTDDMLIIRGVNVYPSQIEQVLMGIAGVAPHYQVVLGKRGSMDTVEVQVEVGPDFAFDEIRELETLQRTVTGAIASALAVSVDVRLVEPRSIQRSEGKAKRVVDLRNEGV